MTEDTVSMIPEDLGVKVAPKEAAEWMHIRDNAKKNKEQMQRELLIAEAVERFAETQIEKHK